MFPGLLAELRWPFAAIDIAKRRQRCVQRHHRRRQPILLDRNPMLNREPLVPRARIHVFGRINHSVLNLILKLRVRHGERKSKVDPFFLEYRLHVDLFDQLYFLLVFVNADFCMNLWR